MNQKDQSTGTTRIPADLFFEETFHVEERHCISRLDPALPRVLATFVIVEWMEISAATAILPYMGHKNITVGTQLSIKHSSIVIPRAVVSVGVKLVGQERNNLIFDISAAVRGRVIGKATHQRTIVPYALVHRQIAREERRCERVSRES